MRLNMATKRWYCPTCLIMSDTIWHINQITNLAIWITANLGNNPDAEFCPSFDFEKSFRNLGILRHLKDLKQRGCCAYCAKSVKVCQRRPKVPNEPRVSKIFINAKCGKNAKSVKSEFKVGSWSLSVIVMLQNFQRLVSLLASQIQRHLLFRRIFVVLLLLLTFLQCETPFQMPLASNWRGWGLSSPPREPRLCLSNNNKQTYKQISFGLWTNQRLWEEKAKSQSIGSAPVQWPNFERNDFVTLSNHGRQCFHVVRRPSRPNWH